MRRIQKTIMTMILMIGDDGVRVWIQGSHAKKVQPQVLVRYLPSEACPLLSIINWDQGRNCIQLQESGKQHCRPSICWYFGWVWQILWVIFVFFAPGAFCNIRDFHHYHKLSPNGNHVSLGFFVDPEKRWIVRIHFENSFENFLWKLEKDKTCNRVRSWRGQAARKWGWRRGMHRFYSPESES